MKHKFTFRKKNNKQAFNSEKTIWLNSYNVLLWLKFGHQYPWYAHVWNNGAFFPICRTNHSQEKAQSYTLFPANMAALSSTQNCALYMYLLFVISFAYCFNKM